MRGWLSKGASCRTGRRRWLGALLAGTLAALSIGPQLPAVAATDLTMFVLDSTPGEYVVGGKTLAFTPENATIGAGQFGDGLFMSVSNDNNHFFADITPPTGQALLPGTYPTTRFDTASTAGLSVTGNGVGCNSATGSITVHEVSIQTQPQFIVERFAATFEYRCEGVSPPLFGELRYLSSVDVRAATVDPYNAILGQSLVDVMGVPRTITIANVGTLDLALGSASFTGPNAADFSVVNDKCSNSTLAPAVSCTLDVAATPSAVGTRDEDPARRRRHHPWASRRDLVGHRSRAPDRRGTERVGRASSVREACPIDGTSARFRRGERQGAFDIREAVRRRSTVDPLRGSEGGG